MTRDAKKRLLSACAMCALTVGPTLAQTTTGPSTKQPGTESTRVEVSPH
jgi:hypothetical protein